jgi:hypothetical protein
MKKFYFFSFLLLLFALISIEGWGQNEKQAHPNHYKIQKNGMIVLGSWAMANFLTGGIQMARTEGKPYYFYQGNVLWNTVNLGIAVSGYLGTTGHEPLGSLEALDGMHQFSKVLMLNTGLDAAYIMTGLYLKERAKNLSKHSDRLTGYGNALLLQGSFLLAFDAVLLALNEAQIEQFMENTQLNAWLVPGTAGITFSF